MDKRLYDNLSKETTIVNKLGLHARSASKIAALAQKAKSNVWIIRDNEAVDAKSILDILTLACQPGTRITVKIDSALDIDVLNNIISLIENGFGE